MCYIKGMALQNILPSVQLSLLDKVVSYFSPRAGLNRIRSKCAVNSLYSSGYITSKSHKRSMRSWFTSVKTADEDIIPNVEQARADSRDLYMNAPIAGAIIKRIATNAVGTGLYLQSRIDREVLGLTDEVAAEKENQIEREFNLWASSKLCDVTAMQNFYELQNMVVLNTLLSGDVFTVMPIVPRKGFPYDLRIKLIEADYCSNPQGVPDTVQIAAGIELDDDDAPVKYHFRKQRYGAFSLEWIAVDAFGQRTGRRNVLHHLVKERPGQRRGMPVVAAIVEDLKQVTRLKEAELMGAIVASFFTVFIKSITPNVGGLSISYPVGDQAVPTEADGTPKSPLDKQLYEMGSGNIIELDSDEEIQVADSKRPATGFNDFYTAVARGITANAGVPYEVVMLAFTASYSASRAALLEAWKFFKVWRMWTTCGFNMPVYENWFTEAVVKGRIGAAGFFDDPIIKQAWLGSVWVGSGAGMIDPLKETKAAVLRTKNWFSTREDEATAIHGGTNGTFQGIVDRKKREDELIGSSIIEGDLKTDEDVSLESLQDEA